MKRYTLGIGEHLLTRSLMKPAAARFDTIYRASRSRKHCQQRSPIVEFSAKSKTAGRVETRSHQFLDTFPGFGAVFIGSSKSDSIFEQMSYQRIGLQLRVDCLQRPSLSASQGHQLIKNPRIGGQINSLIQLPQDGDSIERKTHMSFCFGNSILLRQDEECSSGHSH